MTTAFGGAAKLHSVQVMLRVWVEFPESCVGLKGRVSPSPVRMCCAGDLSCCPVPPVTWYPCILPPDVAVSICCGWNVECESGPTVHSNLEHLFSLGAVRSSCRKSSSIKSTLCFSNINCSSSPEYQLSRPKSLLEVREEPVSWSWAELTVVIRGV